MSETRNWSDQQKKIFEWFRHPDRDRRHAIIRARAGCAKTSSLTEGFRYAPEDNILYAVFNTRNKDEAKEKIRDTRVDIRTFHSLGFSYVKRAWRTARPDTTDGVEYDRIAKIVGQQTPDDVFSAVFRLVAFAKSTCVGLPEVSTLRDIADLRGFDAPQFEQPEAGGWNLMKIAKSALEVLEESLERDPEGRISFGDMIWLPVAKDWVAPRYDLIAADEYQDLTQVQTELVKRAIIGRGRMCVVGDDRQCHPAGTMVEVTGGSPVRIEDLQISTQLVSYHDCFRGIRTQGRKVLDKAVRYYTGDLLRIQAAEKMLKVTPNHLMPVRVTKDLGMCYCVYLMETGSTSRIGCCQFNYYLGVGPTMRARQERADKFWILQVFKDKQEARINETLIALRFGLPEKSGLKNKLNKRLLDAIGDNRASAIRCLEEYRREYAFPYYDKSDPKHIGKYVHVTQACNLISGVHEVRIYQGTKDGGGWEVIKSITREVVNRIPVYSLKVEPAEGGLKLYVADGILTHNCIYQFRGARENSLDEFKRDFKAFELNLTRTFRCAKAIVKRAAIIVPDFEAAPQNPEGLVEENIPRQKMIESLTPGNVVLSRVNAPLMGLCIQMLKRGITARIEGKDIGASLIGVVKRFNARDLDHYLDRLDGWKKSEIKRAQKSSRYPEQKIAEIEDKAEMLSAVTEGCHSIQEVINRLESLFIDSNKERKPAVIFSSVHKFKGLEADKVFVLEDTFKLRFTPKPQRFATKLEITQSNEEANIKYVAITRARMHLVFVKNPEPPKTQPIPQPTQQGILLSDPKEKSVYQLTHSAVPT